MEIPIENFSIREVMHRLNSAAASSGGSVSLVQRDGKSGMMRGSEDKYDAIDIGMRMDAAAKVVGDLEDPQDKLEWGVAMKEQGNYLHSQGKYKEAEEVYIHALMGLVLDDSEDAMDAADGDHGPLEHREAREIGETSDTVERASTRNVEQPREGVAGSDRGASGDEAKDAAGEARASRGTDAAKDEARASRGTDAAKDEAKDEVMDEAKDAKDPVAESLHRRLEQARDSSVPMMSRMINLLQVPCLTNLAACKIATEDYEAAEKLCGIALGIDSSNFKAWLRCGIAAGKLEKFPEAHQYLDRAERLAESRPSGAAVAKARRDVKALERKFKAHWRREKKAFAKVQQKKPLYSDRPDVKEAEVEPATTPETAVKPPTRRTVASACKDLWVAVGRVMIAQCPCCTRAKRD